MNNRAAVGGGWQYLSLIVLLGLLLAQSVRADQDVPPLLAHRIPAGAVAYAEIADWGPVIARVKSSQALEEWLNTPALQAVQESPGYRKALAGRNVLETQLGTDLWTVAQSVLGKRGAVAFYPQADGADPDLVAVIQWADPDLVQQLKTRVTPLLELAGKKIERAEAIAGRAIWIVEDKLFVAPDSKWIAIASRADLLNRTLQLLNDGTGDSLADEEPFAAMLRKMGGTHHLRAWINMRRLTADKRWDVPQTADSVPASLLFGGLLALARNSPYAGLTLDVDETSFLLTIGLSGDSRELGDAHRGFFSDPDDTGTREIPRPDGTLGGFTVYRDLAVWYRNREQLVPENSLPEFDKFETGLANLLPGRDFSEDILPLVGRRLTFLSARQDFSHLDGIPGVKLPGFALIIELAEPEQAADHLRLMLQTLTALLSVQAGQQGRQPWLMESTRYQGVPISYGRYLEKPSGDRLPIAYNFTPAWARVKDSFIISSSLGLCRQLVRCLQKEPDASRRPNRNLTVEFYPGPFADFLQDTRELIQAREVQNGKTLQQVQAEFALALRILRSFEAFRFSTSVKPQAFHVELEGRWK